MYTYIPHTHPGPFHFNEGKTNSPLKDLSTAQVIRLFYRWATYAKSVTRIITLWERQILTFKAIIFLIS